MTLNDAGFELTRHLHRRIAAMHTENAMLEAEVKDLKDQLRKSDFQINLLNMTIEVLTEEK